MTRITFRKESIEKIYLEFGKRKLKTDVSDICDVIFEYLKATMFPAVDPHFGPEVNHPGALRCYNFDGTRLKGSQESHEITTMEIDIYPIINKRTLMKDVPEELNDDPTKTTEKQNNQSPSEE